MKPIDRSIDRFFEPQLSCHLASCQEFRTAREKKKRRGKKKKKEKREEELYYTLPKSGLISNEGFSFSFSNRVTFDFCHVDAIDRNSRLNFLFAMSNDRETKHATLINSMRNREDRKIGITDGGV